MFPILNLLRLAFLSLVFLPSYFLARNRAIYKFLGQAGPSFIKLGQLLSTRSDLIGERMANSLASLQDQLPPTPPRKIKKILAEEFGENFSKNFADFNLSSVASASIAQVHKAKLRDGTTVAVKILHPHISKIMARDISSLILLSKILGIFSKFLEKSLSDITSLLSQTSKDELDLLQEAANASQLRENLQNLEGFYVPQIFWNLSSKKILVSEWIDGIPFSDKKKIQECAFDKKEIAKNLVISYFNQVYVHGFFHADMHPGNLFLLKNGKIAAVDFGIMGKIDKKTRLAVAEILIGFLNKDYNKVAQVHIDARFVPIETRIEELALSCRKIGEMIVDSSVKEISLAKLLSSLIAMTRDYQMTTNPELLLLQKTLLLVEGVGVALDPNLNIWDLARPWVKDWAKRNIGFDAKIRDGILDLLQLTKNFLKKFSST